MTDESKEHAKMIFNEIIRKASASKPLIDKITNIKIEYAPTDRDNYLGDGTSFDTYIEYIAEDGQMVRPLGMKAPKDCPPPPLHSTR